MGHGPWIFIKKVKSAFIQNRIRHILIKTMAGKANPGASRVDELCSVYKKLEQELAETNNQSLDERKQEIMSLLHEFNDVKDAAQVVIGVLANLEGKTIKDMHIHYNLPTSE